MALHRPPGRADSLAIWLPPLLAITAALTAIACDEGLRIGKIDPQLAYVGETFELEIRVAGTGGGYTLWFEGPELANLHRWADLVERPSGGLFRWTPQSDHIGVHTFVFIADDGVDSARREVVIDVQAAREGSPVFRAPPPVVPLDLDVDTCLSVPVEVADLDTPEPAVRVVSGLPAGAELDVTGPGEALLTWCPKPDQTAAASQWVVRLEADDGEHDPVVRDLRVVLVEDPKRDCSSAATPPAVTWLYPEEGEWVTSFVGYDVGLAVESPHPLRDPPILFYTLSRVDPREDVDFTAFEAVAFEWADDHWLGHLPSFVLAEDEQLTLTLLAWVTVDADPGGTRCDAHAEPITRRFVAVGAVEAGVLPNCAPCVQSGDCSSGVCLPTPSGGRCVTACAQEGACEVGVCQRRNAAEGVLRWACGEVEQLCEGRLPCLDDEHEDNDLRDSSVLLERGDRVEAMLCDGDPDVFAIPSGPEARVALRLEAPEADGSEIADLELRLSDERGAIVGLTGGDGSLTVEHCVAAGAPLVAEVFAPTGGRAPYTLLAETTPASCACVDDGFEPDSEDEPIGLLSDASTHDAEHNGRLCPGDTDYFAITGVDGYRARVVLEVIDTEPPASETEADLDIDLRGVDGRRLAASTAATGDEWLEVDLEGDESYLLRVFAAGGGASDYRLTVTREPLAACVAAADCALGETCLDERCRRLPCRGTADCPDGHGCPELEPGRAATCLPVCTGDDECPADWRCKQFVAARACAPEGPGATGATCLAASDCAGAAVCLDWPGGYCAVTGCEAAWSCEEGEVCAVIDGRSVCVRDCWTADAVCARDAPYVCDELVAPDNDVVFGCFPESR